MLMGMFLWFKPIDSYTVVNGGVEAVTRPVILARLPPTPACLLIGSEVVRHADVTESFSVFS